VDRHQQTLFEFDTGRLVRVGRPQLDLRPPSVLRPSSRRTVLYAPTFEGDADYNNYSSIDRLGPEIVAAALAVPDVRVVYQPHPRVPRTQDPFVRSAHRDVVRLLAEAAERDPGAGHAVLEETDILAVMPDCDAIVTDVSSVGLDWLYLRTECPLFITDRHDDPERLRLAAPVSRCADVVDTSTVGRLTELLTARLDHDELHLARIGMRHHYFDDVKVGDSTARFVAAVLELTTLRDQLLATQVAQDPLAGEPTG
jgi:hypothetical protein